MFSYAVAGVGLHRQPSRIARDGVDRHARYRPPLLFRPPRMLEGLLTHVMIRMEDAGYIKRKLFHAYMNLARRVGTRILDGQPVGLWDRLRYRLATR